MNIILLLILIPLLFIIVFFNISTNRGKSINIEKQLTISSNVRGVYDEIFLHKLKKSKKIALCFLIYEEIFHENIWYNFLKNIDNDKYNIYIHYKKDKPLKYFEKYKLKTIIETCWGCLSIVMAQNLLLEEALKDPKNTNFIWLSDACIPIKSFDYIYNYLDLNKSYYNICHDEHVSTRASKLSKYIKKSNIKKASMPSIITRKHAQIFFNNENNIKTWFANIDNADEIVHITLLHIYNLTNELEVTYNIAANAVIFTSWPDMKNYKIFEQSIIISETNPKTYKYICLEELYYLINSKSLFARKFVKNCGGLDKLYAIF